MRTTLSRKRRLAAEMLREARRDHADIDDHGLDALLAPHADADAGAPACLAPAWYARAPRSRQRDAVAEILAP